MPSLQTIENKILVLWRIIKTLYFLQLLTNDDRYQEPLLTFFELQKSGKTNKSVKKE